MGKKIGLQFVKIAILSCIGTTPLIQLNYSSKFEPRGFTGGFNEPSSKTAEIRHFSEKQRRAGMPLQNGGCCYRRFHSARNICKRKKCDYDLAHEKHGCFHSHTSEAVLLRGASRLICPLPACRGSRRTGRRSCPGFPSTTFRRHSSCSVIWCLFSFPPCRYHRKPV